jgi:hypothetical protein
MTGLFSTYEDVLMHRPAAYLLVVRWQQALNGTAEAAAEDVAPRSSQFIEAHVGSITHYHTLIKGLIMTKQNGFNGIVRKLHLSFVSRFSPAGSLYPAQPSTEKPPHQRTSLQNSNAKWYTESKTKEKHLHPHKPPSNRCYTSRRCLTYTLGGSGEGR